MTSFFDVGTLGQVYTSDLSSRDHTMTCDSGNAGDADGDRAIGIIMRGIDSASATATLASLTAEHDGALADDAARLVIGLSNAASTLEERWVFDPTGLSSQGLSAATTDSANKTSIFFRGGAASDHALVELDGEHDAVSGGGNQEGRFRVLLNSGAENLAPTTVGLLVETGLCTAPAFSSASATFSGTTTFSAASGVAINQTGASASVDIAGTLNLDKTTTSTLVIDSTDAASVTLAGGIDIEGVADIADTLTLSKASGTGLSVSANAAITGALTVAGDFTVSGLTTTVNSRTLDIEDNILLMNNGPRGVAAADSGIMIERHPDNLTPTASAGVLGTQVAATRGFSLVLNAGENAADDFYNLLSIRIDDGIGIGLLRTVTDYTGATKTAIIDTAAETSTTQAGSISTTIVLNTGASLLDDHYNGWWVQDTTLSEGQYITDYVGSTRTATVSAAWSVTPGTGDAYDLYADPWPEDAQPASGDAYTFYTDPISAFVFDESASEFILASTTAEPTGTAVPIVDYLPLHLGGLTADDNVDVAGVINLDAVGGTTLVVDSTAANSVTLAGGIDVAGIGDYADTLTASKASGSALAQSNAAATTDLAGIVNLTKTGAGALVIAGALDSAAAADFADTITASKASGSALAQTNTAATTDLAGVVNMTKTGAGAVVISGEVGVADTLTASKASGSALAQTNAAATTDLAGIVNLTKTGAGALVIAGALDSAAAADFADTITASKASGSALAQTNAAATTDLAGVVNMTKTGAGAVVIAGALDSAAAADFADTITASKASGSALAQSNAAATTDLAGIVNLTKTGAGALVIAGALDSAGVADFADTVTCSKGSGTGLSVTAGVTAADGIFSSTLKNDAGTPFNTWMGDLALDSVDGTALHCTGMGYNAGTAVTTGDNHTAVGSGALATMSTNSDATAVGYNAATLATVTTTAVGSGALDNLAAGLNNSALGYMALTACTSGSYNNAFGDQSLVSLSTTNGNDAFGFLAGERTTGNNNSFFGLEAARYSSGSNNVAFGSQACRGVYLSTTGDFNVSVGSLANYAMTSGHRNVCVGYSAGNSGTAITSGNNNTLLGNTAQVDSAVAASRIGIGSGVSATADSGVFFAAHRTSGTGTNAYWSGAELLEETSTRKVKKNIRDYKSTGNFDQLRPVWYQSKLKVDGDRHLVGLVAEDLEDANYPELVAYDEHDEPSGVFYERMCTVLIKEVQELRKRVTALEEGAAKPEELVDDTRPPPGQMRPEYWNKHRSVEIKKQKANLSKDCKYDYWGFKDEDKPTGSLHQGVEDMEYLETL